MSDSAKLGPWVRRFLLEHLIGERNLSRGTQRSYRDTLAIFIPFTAGKVRKAVDQLKLEDLSAERVKMFLRDVEENRGCAISTRNQRLASIRSLARFVALHSPEHIAWCEEIRRIPFKKGMTQPVTYLDKPEMDAFLAAPNREIAQGRRDYLLLLFLYNTGARADEAAQLLIGDLNLANAPNRDSSSVTIRGKGNKLRRCPLWPQTANELIPVVSHRAATEHVFLNRYSRPITRFGVHALVERYAKRVSNSLPALTKKRVSPHTIRHTTATHLLRAGVDINTIRAWLGHVSLSTTNIYAEVDLEMKAKALAHCEPPVPKRTKRWADDKSLMAFLRAL